MANTGQQQLQQQRWLKDMGLTQQDMQLLTAQNIHTARDLLTQSPIDLMERLNIPLSQAQRLLQHTAMQVAPAYVTVSPVAPSQGTQTSSVATCWPGCLRRHQGLPLWPPSTMAVCLVGFSVSRVPDAVAAVIRTGPSCAVTGSCISPPPLSWPRCSVLLRPWSCTAPCTCTLSRYSLGYP